MIPNLWKVELKTYVYQRYLELLDIPDVNFLIVTFLFHILS